MNAIARQVRDLSALLLLASAPLLPRAAGPAPGGEPENESRRYPPSRVDQRLLDHHKGWLTEVARRIRDGKATQAERRAYDWLAPRLAPFELPPPDDWRERARAAMARLAPPPGPAKIGPLLPLTTYRWSQLTPATYIARYGSGHYTSGRATAIWSALGNKNTILLGTADGGLWKTTDGGTTWAPLFDGQTSLSIGSIAVDPNNAGIIYVGTGEGNFSGDGLEGGGIYKSIDGGANWSKLTVAFYYAQPYQEIRRMAVDPRDSNKVYAAGDGGVYYSLNGGTNWVRTSCGGASGQYYATDILLDSVTPGAGSPSIVYAAFGGVWSGLADNGIYRSTNAGTAWTKISAAPGGSGFAAQASLGRIALAQAPSAPKQIYALTESTATSDNLGIYYSADASAAPAVWTAKNTTTTYLNGQGWYAISGAVDPTAPANLVLGGLDDYFSTDSGLTLNQVSVWSSGGTNFSHADHHFLVMPDHTTIYDANDGGMFVGTVNYGSAPPSVTWADKNIGLPTQQFYSLAGHPTNPAQFHGGLQDNGDAYFDGSNYRELFGGDGGDAAWDQSSPQYIYEEYVDAYINRNSNVNGAPDTWSCITNFGGCACVFFCIPDGATDFIAPFALDPNNQNTLYAASNRLYADSAARTSSAWSALSGDLTAAGGNIHFIHPAKNGGVSGTIYVSTTNGKVQMTANNGGLWNDRSAGLSGATVTGITTDPANGQRALLAVSGFTGPRIYRSTTGGAGWTDISGALPLVPFNAVILDPADANHAYAGSDMGVYENTAVWTGTTWTSITANLPMAAVTRLAFNPATGALRAATHGRAVWERRATVANPVPDGKFIAGNPLRAAKGAGSNINVTFDTVACSPGGYNAHWGTLSAVALPTYAYSGSQCGIASGGALTTIPAATSAFFIIAGTDGGTSESRNVQDSAGVWHGTGTGLCGITAQDAASTCP